MVLGTSFNPLAPEWQNMDTIPQKPFPGNRNRCDFKEDYSGKIEYLICIHRNVFLIQIVWGLKG